MGWRHAMLTPPAPWGRAIGHGGRCRSSRLQPRIPRPAQSPMLFRLQCMNLLKQGLFVVHANPVGRHIEVVEADLPDQRLPPFIFTPGANDFHTTLNEQG